MTTLQEACAKALEYAETQCGGRCNSEYNPCHAYEVADCLRTALAQQGEPVVTDEMVAAAIRANAEWAHDGGDDRNPWVVIHRAMLAAAPQPQTDAEYQSMTANGAKAWAGVDPQELRTGMKPLTDAQIRRWWASENDLEDCDMCRLDDFTKVVRAMEAKFGIGAEKVGSP